MLNPLNPKPLPQIPELRETPENLRREATLSCRLISVFFIVAFATVTACGLGV